MRRPAAALLLLLAACGSEQPAADDATPAEGPPATEAVTAAGEIPEDLQGRWGQTSADCDPANQNAQGLLVVSGDTLEFYESTGTLDAVETSEPGHVRGQFAFSGEGFDWTHEMELTAEDGTLTVMNHTEGAEVGPGGYERCA